MNGLLVQRDGPLLLLTIDRPAHENRLTREVLREIEARLRAADEDDEISAVAITGAGEWFCGGAQMAAGTDEPTEALLAFGDAWLAVRDTAADVGKPLIAAVNGKAFAGGLALTALADLAFAVRDATFGLPELQYGIFPMLVLAIVQEHLPRKVLFELIYQGRVLGAEEARRLGLLNEILAPDDLRPRLRATAERLARANPVALRIGRRAAHAMDGMTGHERMVLARHVGANLLSTRRASDDYRRRTEPPREEERTR